MADQSARPLQFNLEAHRPAEWLVLRRALKAWRRCTSRTLRAFADAEWAVGEQTLCTRLGADSRGTFGIETRVASDEDESGDDT